MHWLEAFLDSIVVGKLTALERATLRVAGMMVLMLLFAGDTTLMSNSREVLQRILDTLWNFCTQNGLAVSVKSVKKTKWMIGGVVPQNGVGQLFCDDRPLEAVPEFKCLGLVYTGDDHMQAMMGSHIAAAKEAWHVLQS